MSAPARGRGGGTSSRGITSTPRNQTSSQRGNAATARRGRGRGRAGTGTVLKTSAGNNAAGVLQKMRTGTMHRSNDNSSTPSVRGQNNPPRARFGASARARGHVSKTLNTSRATLPPPSSTPPSSYRDFMAQMSDRYNSLKPQRDAERKRAINDGFLSDPEKKTSLANAITPVGTCTEMCPQFERVERIVQNMVDKAEKIPNDATGRDVPSEARMVKRFRRSAAGYDEQLPSDIRTPETLRKTLDYLLDRIVGGGERLASIHKFVWDRTRGIRNDFSIQQVTRQDDVGIAVDCYERIARFHILSLHQLSNPDNLQEGEHFDPHQEREQLNNTLLSLMYYYDDNRGKIPLPNEPEFRSYSILFELQALHPDVEDRMQSWPVELLVHPKVQAAARLHAAAQNTILDQGPLRPLTFSSIAQANSGKFWTILSSQEVSYIMACVAEINFGVIRFVALDALWRSGKSAPQSLQARNQDWTLGELQNYLAFDNEDQTLDFCEAFDLAFKLSDHGEQCLDFAATSSNVLDKTSIPSRQVFSHDIVEEKRHRRTLVAVINGVGVAAAIRQGLVVETVEDGDGEGQQHADGDEDQTMFIPEESTQESRKPSMSFGNALNPTAAIFEPSSVFGSTGAPFTPNQSSQPVLSTMLDSSPGTPILNQGFGFGTTSTPKTTTRPLFQTNGGGNLPSQDVGTQQSQQPAQSIFESGMFGAGAQGSVKPEAAVTGASAPDVNDIHSISKPTVKIAGNSFPSPRNSEIFPLSSQQTTETKPTGFTTFSKTPTVFGSNFGQTVQQPQQTGDRINPSASLDSTLFGGKLLGAQVSQDSKTAGSNMSVTPSNTFGFSFETGTSPAAPAATQSSLPVTSASSVPAIVTEGQKTMPSFASASLPKPVGSVRPSSQHPSNIFAPGVESPNSRQSAPSFFIPSQTSATSKQDILGEQQAQPSFSTYKSNQSATPQQSLNESQSGILQSSPSVGSKPSSLTFSPQTPEQTAIALNPVESSPRPSVAPSLAFSGQGSSTSREPTMPIKPAFTIADHERLIENTSRLILTQPQGLIEYFVSHHVSNLLQNVVKRHLQEQHDDIITYVRTRHLSRKFCAIWKQRVQNEVMKRRTKQRRKLLAAAMQAEQDKKQRGEAELEAILAASRESKRIRQEQQNLRSVNSVQQAETLPTQDRQVDTLRVAGRKRKTVSQVENTPPTSATLQRTWSAHKRSRTVDNTSQAYSPGNFSTSHNSFRTSSSNSGNSLLGRSSLNQLSNPASMRQSLSQKVDSTKTDYFKLKAMGIDPNTPLVPDTAKTLVERRRKEQEDRQILLSRSRTRPSILSASTASRPSSPLMQPPAKPAQAMTQSSTSKSTLPLATSSPSIIPPEEDSFLRQLREARQSLADDAGWFKNQTSVLEQEIEQQEELCRRRNSLSASRQASPRSSINGVASANGHDFYAIEPKAGRTLSRTEERIRRTGAHGLATRPTGSDYVPVAMSRRSALRYSYGAADETTSMPKKRMREDEENAQTQPASRTRGRIEAGPILGTTQATRATSNKTSFNAFAALQKDEDEDEGLGAENEFDPTHRNGADGDTEDNDEDLLEEEEEISDEDEVEEDEEDTMPHYVLPNGIPMEERVYDDGDEGEEEEGEGEEEEYDEENDDDDAGDATPGTYPEFSRAQSGSSTGMQSGPGASVDDALVLSD